MTQYNRVRQGWREALLGHGLGVQWGILKAGGKGKLCWAKAKLFVSATLPAPVPLSFEVYRGKDINSTVYGQTLSLGGC